MRFKTLAPEVARKLLYGEEDALTPEVNRVSEIYRYPCPRCGGKLSPRLDTQRPFSPGSPLPRNMCTCDECGYSVDPVSRLVVNWGNPAKVEDPYDISGGDPKD